MKALPHDESKRIYSRFREKELTKKLKISSNEKVVIRLDGVKMSQQSKSKNKLYNVSLLENIKEVATTLFNHIQGINQIYCFKDELSIILEKNSYFLTKHNYRFEKILSIIPGFVSGLYSLRAGEIGTFDCRLILIEDNETDDYIYSRRNFAMTSFADRYNSFHYLKERADQIEDIIKVVCKDGYEINQLRQEAYGILISRDQSIRSGDEF